MKEAGNRAPVWIAAGLLALQGAATLGVAWRLTPPRDWVAPFREAPLAAAVEIVRSSAFGWIALAVLAFGSSLGFVRLRRGAWLYAMMLQALVLGVALASHWRDGPAVAYLPMAYGVLMVFYLNSRPVRSILHGNGERHDRVG